MSGSPKSFVSNRVEGQDTEGNIVTATALYPNMMVVTALEARKFSFHVTETEFAKKVITLSYLVWCEITLWMGYFWSPIHS